MRNIHVEIKYPILHHAFCIAYFVPHHCANKSDKFSKEAMSDVSVKKYMQTKYKLEESHISFIYAHTVEECLKALFTGADNYYQKLKEHCEPSKKAKDEKHHTTPGTHQTTPGTHQITHKDEPGKPTPKTEKQAGHKKGNKPNQPPRNK